MRPEGWASWVLGGLFSVASLGSVGCGGPKEAGPPPPSTASSRAGPAAVPSASNLARIAELRRAEATRDGTAVTGDDLDARDPGVRRAAMRAFARQREPEHRGLMLRGLRDEDAETRMWAAYGLGEVCEGAREATVRALVAAAVAQPDDADPPRGAPPASTVTLGSSAAPVASAPTPAAAPGALAAITWSLGRCGTDSAEATLTAWLRIPGSAAAATRALGDVARVRKRLREETYVALLQRAEGDAEHPPDGRALYPLGQVAFLTPSVVERARAVASARLEDSGIDGAAAAAAVRTLARCGASAQRDVTAVIHRASLPLLARLAAVDSLVRFADAGQRALGRSLVEMVPGIETMLREATPPAALHVPLAVLTRLRRTREARAALQSLAELAPPADATPLQRRRTSLVRCRAAALLVERDYDDARLQGCDLSRKDDDEATEPWPDSLGARVRLDAVGVDAVRLAGPRLETWRAYARQGAPTLRAQAIRQLVAHEEVAQAPAILTEALRADAPGVVAAAAEVITDRPARAGAPDASVTSALLAYLGRGPTADQEALAAVVAALAALEHAPAKPGLMELCGSGWPTLRGAAETALARLAGPKGESPRCRATAPRAAPPELETVAVDPTTNRVIRLDTDVGPLRLSLDPTFAPWAVKRILSLVAHGHYDGLVVHRVEPGFVVQFGSPTGDGYGGVEGLAALPCETAPIPFGRYHVGVALAGRDTGSSQLFVTLAPQPRLTGAYAWVGTASGPWPQLVAGDRIERAVVAP
ncbi:MAG: peptidylprolyl isomerase [Myxococcota bacterium]